MFNPYFKKIKQLIDTVEKDEIGALNHAASKIAECIQNNGILHVFGCGHSHMLGEELFYRAGGLVPVSPILIEDLMLHKGAVRSSKLERQNGLGREFMQHISIEPGDVMIVASTSGRNPVPIDVADTARERGAFVIAITSPRYANTQSSRHSSGKYLYQAGDLTIDNHIEAGDTLMKEEALDIGFGSGSTIIGMAILNGIITEAVNIMISKGFTPPIFKSGNVDGTMEHNRKLIDRYKNRIPMLES
jgi:uncharacterized phosphosugar-binding protein